MPVAHIAGFCEDESVNGAPFYVMDFVEGPILRGRPDADAYDERRRRAIGERVVDTLVDIHAVEPDDVGLGELGKKRTTSPAPCIAGRASGRRARRGRSRWSTRCTTGWRPGSRSRARRRSSTATTGWTT